MAIKTGVGKRKEKQTGCGGALGFGAELEKKKKIRWEGRRGGRAVVVEERDAEE